MDDESPSPSYVLKMVALGDGAVGKTSCIMRYTEDSFGDDYKATIGTNIAVKNIEIELVKGEQKTAQVVLWDLAGQPTYKDLRSRYMVGSSIAFLVFDVTRPITFLNVAEWYNTFKRVCPDSMVILVANKVDREDRAVPVEAGEMVSKWLGIDWIETSAKTGENVEMMFTKCVETAIRQEEKRQEKKR
ncbi:MAG: GTP-binding protein [Candidatus Thorarchaeota archaeon]